MRQSACEVFSRFRLLFCVLLTLAAGLAVSSPVAAQPAEQYRAFWVDTFNTTLNNHNDVLAVVNNARACNANAIFAQVRRRGDAWYLNSLESLPDGVPIAPGFDPLQDLIDTAHAQSIEVHAFVIIGAVWNRHPTILPPPTDPNHMFNRHGFNQATGQIYTGRDNWLTRTLLNVAGITFAGHRFGAEFWMEPGHPDAAAYTVDVLNHLVRNYDIDGLHLDRIRYPEFTAPGQTPANGTNIGYNETNVARFQARYGIAPGPPPAQNDPLWNQWRRDQVSNLVRRIYLNALAVKPQLKVSAALIAFSGGPTTEASWNNAEAYWRVYQDWRAWTEEGILDIAMPMNYKREHDAAQANQYNQWDEWTKNHQYNRAALIGQGVFLNSIEGSLRQTRRALAPSSAGNSAKGVIFFSMATSNALVNGNPYSIPAGQNTPARSFAEFAAGYTTGKSVNGLTFYEDPALNPIPVFSQPAAIPALPWKTNPQAGHLMGFITDEAGAVVDAGDVVIARVDDGTTPAAGRTSVATATDGGGFYGGVDLAPGSYRVTVTPTGQAAYTTECAVQVAAGQVASFNVTIDRLAPAGSFSADPQRLWPPNHKLVTVTLTGEATDGGVGIQSVAFRVIDEYGRVEPVIAPLDGAGQAAVNWTRVIQLESARDGNDRDGRLYTIEAIVTDRACNTRTLTTTVIVPHDQGN